MNIFIKTFFEEEYKKLDQQMEELNSPIFNNGEGGFETQEEYSYLERKKDLYEGLEEKLLEALEQEDD